ncbi:MAG: UDP-N-acetylmuramoyl-L-alanyl-D-glutamate--2,6-diaminopimelate ligase [Bacteroidota bacterium]|nr:UDP-N-acetylmuramoyl-L-alanyl-D-glutamate--2,6-diaminopimelate ligase [Bacteroidota bacterium]
MAKKLNELTAGAGIIEIKGATDIEISSLEFDSRKAGQGSLFFAIRGTVSDGHKFIAQAVAQGASAIVCEEFPEKIYSAVTYILVMNSKYAEGIMSGHFWDNPSLKLTLVGVTGTNGKTTTATLLYELFKSLGYRAGLISTIENRIADEVVPADHTTPDPLQLNELMAEMLEKGCTYCFMEVSSHAIDQQRIAGLNFKGGIFTNITHDHLDYHKTFAAYLKAKKTFFDNLPPDAFALVNKDDKNGLVMAQNTQAKVYTYSLRALADFRCRIIENHFDGLQLNIDGTDCWFRLIGEFNAYNLLVIYATAVILGEDRNKVLTEMSRFEPVNGRFNSIRSASGITAIVDYAHTPDALQNVLETIHAIRSKNERIITVVGAGGNRDRTKRPIMASISCRLSDHLILTSDNPRFEEPGDILKEMEAGLEPEDKSKVLVIENRREAIRTACALAKPGDIILVAGKGHETYQDIKGIKHHFDDKEVLKEALGIND